MQDVPEDADRMQWKFAWDKPVIMSEFGAEARTAGMAKRMSADRGVPGQPLPAPDHHAEKFHRWQAYRPGC
jgi:hypothetical protein